MITEYTYGTIKRVDEVHSQVERERGIKVIEDARCGCRSDVSTKDYYDYALDQYQRVLYFGSFKFFANQMAQFYGIESTHKLSEFDQLLDSAIRIGPPKKGRNESKIEESLKKEFEDSWFSTKSASVAIAENCGEKNTQRALDELECYIRHTLTNPNLQVIPDKDYVSLLVQGNQRYNHFITTQLYCRYTDEPNIIWDNEYYIELVKFLELNFKDCTQVAIDELYNNFIHIIRAYPIEDYKFSFFIEKLNAEKFIKHMKTVNLSTNEEKTIDINLFGWNINVTIQKDDSKNLNSTSNYIRF